MPQTTGRHNATVIASRVLVVLVVPTVPAADGFTIAAVRKQPDEGPRKKWTNSRSVSIGMARIPILLDIPSMRRSAITHVQRFPCGLTVSRSAASTKGSADGATVAIVSCNA